MQSFTVARDNAADLSFTGELLAEVANSPNNAHPDYSDSPGRWTEFKLYRTAKGQYVAQRIDFTQWQGESHTYLADVFADSHGVQEFFGHEKLAKDLYRRAQIDTSIAID